MLTIVCEVSDRAGILSRLLKTITVRGPISSPSIRRFLVDGTAVVSISMQMLENANSVNTIIERIAGREGIRRVRVTGR